MKVYYIVVFQLVPKHFLDCYALLCYQQITTDIWFRKVKTFNISYS